MLIQHASIQGWWKHIALRQNEVKNSHLSFADDFILFAKTTQQGVQVVTVVIEKFSITSGQKVNFHKSKLVLGHSATEQHSNRICNALGVTRMESDLLHLGVPIPFGSKKKKVFKYLVARMHKKTNIWKERALSKAGQLGLIKVVLQSLPIYAMNSLKFPKGICQTFNKILSQFWWNNNMQDQQQSKIHWES